MQDHTTRTPRKLGDVEFETTMHDVTTWDAMGVRGSVECDCTDGQHHGVNDDDDEMTRYYMGRS